MVVNYMVNKLHDNSYTILYILKWWYNYIYGKLLFYLLDLLGTYHNLGGIPTLLNLDNFQWMLAFHQVIFAPRN